MGSKEIIDTCWRYCPAFVWRRWENMRKTHFRTADFPAKRVEVMWHQVDRHFLCVMCVCVCMGCFIILSVFRLWIDIWVIDWKWFGRSQSWPNRCKIPEFVSGTRIPWKIPGQPVPRPRFDTLLIKRITVTRSQRYIIVVTKWSPQMNTETNDILNE
jgi:hypothetical protein